ncbi:MAG TPA: restriction endonuclease [Rhizomicrobium sp.]|jgi:hypothetical protein
MAAIDQATVANYIQTGLNGNTTNIKGRALEDLVSYVFGLVPGITITHRNALNVFDSEEVDVALWNEIDQLGFFFPPNLILVECKNWSKAVGSAEVSWFDTKLRNRGLDLGILVAARGITGDANDLTAAHTVVAAALRERRRLVVITTDELAGLVSTEELATLVKRKLCDLMVKGAI